MMCNCEEEIGKKYYPHQIDFTSDLDSNMRVKVSIGFQNNICNQCRGLPEEAHPKAELYGSTSKIKRYYWRELMFEKIK
jgi:hypothetical protein